MSRSKLKERSRALFIALNNLLRAHLQRGWCRVKKKNQKNQRGITNRAEGARGWWSVARMLGEPSFEALLCIQLPQHPPNLPAKVTDAGEVSGH